MVKKYKVGYRHEATSSVVFYRIVELRADTPHAAYQELWNERPRHFGAAGAEIVSVEELGT